MTEIECGDVLWRQALDWVMREHQEPLDEAACTALHDWLAQAPAHRRAYDQVCALWLATGLIPTAEEREATPANDARFHCPTGVTE